jgi:hypothetical protein
VDFYDEDEAAPERFWPPPDTVLGTETRNVDGASVTRIITGQTLRENYERWRVTREKRHFLRLKIHFTTEENLPELSANTGMPGWLTGEAVFCDDPRAEIYGHIGHGPIFWQGFQLDASPEAISAIKSARKPVDYYFYANVVETRKRTWRCAGNCVAGPGEPLQRNWDLRKELKEVCVRVSLPGWLGRGYRSNEVTISRDAIGAALRELPPYFKDNPEEAWP